MTNRMKRNEMKLTDRRLSELADMMTCHVIWRRSRKALLIAQFLRRYYGSYLVANLDTRTGYRYETE